MYIVYIVTYFLAPTGAVAKAELVTVVVVMTELVTEDMTPVAVVVEVVVEVVVLVFDLADSAAFWASRAALRLGLAPIITLNSW